MGDKPLYADERLDTPSAGYLVTIMTVIVSVVNWISLGWVVSQFTGLKLAAKSVVCVNEAMAAARQMHSAIENERMFQVDCILR